MKLHQLLFLNGINRFMTKLLGTGAKRNLGSTLWKDLDGRQINYHFTRETLPYKRAIAFHAKCAYKQADQRGHVPASFDVALLDHENWSLQDTKQKVIFEATLFAKAKVKSVALIPHTRSHP